MVEERERERKRGKEKLFNQIKSVYSAHTSFPRFSFQKQSHERFAEFCANVRLLANWLFLWVLSLIEITTESIAFK